MVRRRQAWYILVGELCLYGLLGCNSGENGGDSGNQTATTGASETSPPGGQDELSSKTPARDSSASTETSTASSSQAPDVTTSDAPPEHPKVVQTDGPSRLDEPVLVVSQAKLCEYPTVYSNGICLDTVGVGVEGCTALRLQMEASELALVGDTLYYLAGGEEVVEVDLTTNTHRSVVRGLEYASALTFIDGTLYFGAREVDRGLADFDVRSYDLSSKVQTSLGATVDQTGVIFPLGQSLLVGAGLTTPHHMYAVPLIGGELTRELYSAAWLQLDGDQLYNSDDDVIYRRAVEEPSREQVVAVPGRPNARFFVRDGFIYFDQYDNYVKVALDAIEPTVLAALPPWTRIRAQNTAYTFFVGDAPEDDPDREAALGVWRVALEGGELELVATFENFEFSHMLVDDERLYVTSGGAVIIVEL